MKLAAARQPVARAIGFFVLWILLSGANPPALAPGAVAAAVAAWASLRLLPPISSRVRLPALPRFVLHFLYQSVIAGVDVARRAFDPRLPLRPGFVTYRTSLPQSPAGYLFTSLVSLLPGTVPAGSAGPEGLLIHCLDIEQPVATQLAEEEALFAAVLMPVDA